MHRGNADDSGKPSPGFDTFVASIFVQDMRLVGSDLRLQQIVFRSQLASEQTVGRTDQIVSDSRKLRCQLKSTLGDERFEKPHANIGQDALLLRVKLEAILCYLLAGDCLVELTFAAGDESLCDEAALLPGRSLVADLRGVIADDGIGIEPRLNLSATGRSHPSSGRRQRRIVLQCQAFHVGERQRRDRQCFGFRGRQRLGLLRIRRVIRLPMACIFSGGRED